MICASSINVKPVSLSLEVGKWYYGAKASICPPTATCKCVRWRSDNESVATVNPSTGYIYAKKVGTATIYAAATDGSGKTGRLNITVKCNVLVTGIYLGKLCLTLEKGDQYTFNPTVYPSNATNKTLEWSSKNTNIVRVNGSTITAVGLGTTSVVAKATDGSGVSASCTVTVAKQDILVKSITVYPHSGTLTVGNSASLSATVCPEDAENKNVVWSSSDTSIATVNPNSGLVYAKKAGNVIIYADADDGGGARDTCCITVKGVVPVRGVTVSPTHTDMYVGQSQYLSYGIIPENATLKRVSWCSDNDSVVSVGASSGRVVANKPGTAVITVKTADGGYTAKCIVKVSGYKPFEKKYAERLKSEFIDLLGNKKIDIPPLNLFYVNTTEKCIETLLYYDDVITNTANEIGLHKAIIQTILLRELWCINLADVAGDELVENFYKWKDDCEYWESQDESYQASVQYPEKPLLVKSDSSVGLGQIFASTAISANNHAVQSGYICSTWLNPNDWHICKNMWYALRDNDEYNIRMSSLNILSCVDEFGYEHNYNDFTGNQCKLVFSRYNAKTDTIIDYGEECYQYFLIFNKYI